MKGAAGRPRGPTSVEDADDSPLRMRPIDQHTGRYQVPMEQVTVVISSPRHDVWCAQLGHFPQICGLGAELVAADRHQIETSGKAGLQDQTEGVLRRPKRSQVAE